VWTQLCLLSTRLRSCQRFAAFLNDTGYEPLDTHNFLRNWPDWCVRPLRMRTCSPPPPPPPPRALAVLTSALGRLCVM
jgi:hypothetical protein